MGVLDLKGLKLGGWKAWMLKKSAFFKHPSIPASWLPGQ
jgi:hypothetical protein